MKLGPQKGTSNLTATAPSLQQDASLALRETKRLSRQVRTTIQALARLEETCRTYGIELKIETTQPKEAQ